MDNIVEQRDYMEIEFPLIYLLHLLLSDQYSDQYIYIFHEITTRLRSMNCVRRYFFFFRKPHGVYRGEEGGNDRNGIVN